MAPFMADKAHGLELRAAGVTPEPPNFVPALRKHRALDAPQGQSLGCTAKPIGTSPRSRQSRNRNPDIGTIPGATNSPSPVIDPEPRCSGPPVYPQDFLEWLKTSESPARKALRGLVP